MKRRYQLHWASGEAPHQALKWTIYDWRLIKPIAYFERRDIGRDICARLNAYAEEPQTTKKGGSK